MAKTMQFLGKTLRRHRQPKGESGQMWNTRNKDPWPQVSVGEDINGKWFAFVHFRSINSVSARLHETMDEAKSAIKRQLESVRDDIARLDLS